jgi:nucleoside-diphosphate-sugar epimerase
MKDIDIIKKMTCNENGTLIDTIRVIDDAGYTIAIVTDKNNKFVGLIADSDIRRAILSGLDVNDKISKVVNRNPVIMKNKELKNKGGIQQKIEESFRMKADPPIIPIIDENKKVSNLLFIFSDKKYKLLNEGVKQGDVVRRILVIGGAGYLGSVLCRKLLSKGYKVRVMDICLFGEESIEDLKNNKDFELIKDDMRNITAITKALSDVDAVILLAAIVGDPASSAQPIDVIETNYLATKMIAEACKYHQINRFIFASTCSVYGKSDGIADETSQINPQSLYARSKIKSEEAILEMADDNFSPVSMRMGTLYGLSFRMRFDLVVNTFALKAATEGKISIFGGDQWRPLVNVEDAADAYVSCLSAPIAKIRGEIFNVGDESQNYQIKNLGKLTKEVFPDIIIEYKDKETVGGKLDSRNYKVSFVKIKKTLNFKPKKTVKQSIEKIKNELRSGKINDPKNSKYYNLNQQKNSDSFANG